MEFVKQCLQLWNKHVQKNLVILPASLMRTGRDCHSFRVVDFVKIRLVLKQEDVLVVMTR